jgi:hypothetical protein
MKERVVTIRDIAKRAGVSVATVSRTLREPEAVRPAKRDAVKQAIDEMKYVPNAIAQQLRRPRHEAIIVIVPEIANPFFSGIVQSIENVAHELGYRVLIGRHRASRNGLITMPKWSPAGGGRADPARLAVAQRGEIHAWRRTSRCRSRWCWRAKVFRDWLARMW